MEGNEIYFADLDFCVTNSLESPFVHSGACLKLFQLIFGLSKVERPILDHHTKAHNS